MGKEGWEGGNWTAKLAWRDLAFLTCVKIFLPLFFFFPLILFLYLFFLLNWSKGSVWEGKELGGGRGLESLAPPDK